MATQTIHNSTTKESFFSAIEEAFHIDLGSNDLDLSISLDDLARLVLTRFIRGNQDACLAPVAFYRVQQALRQICGIEAEQITREAQLSALLPVEQRRVLWARLGHQLELTLPDLLIPRQLAVALQTAGFAGVVLIVMSMLFQELRVLAGVAALIWIIVAVSSQILRNTKLARQIPTEFATVGLIVDQLVTWKYGYLSHKPGRCNEKQVVAVLQSLIAYQANATPAEVDSTKTLGDLLEIFVR